MQDMILKGRQTRRRISTADVNEMHELWHMGVRQSQIAKKYRVTQAYVSMVVRKLVRTQS
jgi:DNA-binding MarR family transcriptional regulator